MDDLIRLDELSRKPKKSGASRGDKDFYNACFRNLITKNGYTEQCEKYFFDGFVFMGAQPLYEYIIAQDDIKGAYLQLVNGQRYRTTTSSNDIRKKFCMQLQLLTAFLSYQQNEAAVIKEIMKRVATLSKTKDGQYIAGLPELIRKDFLHFILLRKVQLPKFTDEEVMKFRDFFDMLREHFENFNLCLDNPQVNILAKWINCPQKENTFPVKRESPVHENAATVNTVEFTDQLEELSRKNKLLVEENKALLRNNVRLQELLDKKRQILEQQQHIAEESEGNILILQAQIHTLQNQAAKVNEEANDWKHLTTMQKADYDKKMEAMLNRISSQLKVEYRDFLDAKEMEMTIDLGENMRLQLEAIFRILTKSGIKLQ